MKKILALLFVCSAALPVAVADITADITAPIRQFIDSFNTGDTKSAFAAYARGSISIVDEFGPHQWTGPTAPQRWAADYDKNAKATGVTDGKVTYGVPTRMEIAGAQAYVIMPTVYLYKEKGKPMQEEGEITVVLNKEAGAWKMRGWTWSGVKPHPQR